MCARGKVKTFENRKWQQGSPGLPPIVVGRCVKVNTTSTIGASEEAFQRGAKEIEAESWQPMKWRNARFPTDHMWITLKDPNCDCHLEDPWTETQPPPSRNKSRQIVQLGVKPHKSLAWVPTGKLCTNSNNDDHKGPYFTSSPTAITWSEGGKNRHF